MPRNIRKSKVADFEPKKKNPLGLLDDSNLDSDLKTLLIGGEPSGIELSKDRTKINTILEIERVDGNIISTGGLYLSDAQKIVFNSNVGNEWEPFAGSEQFTYMSSRDSTSGSGHFDLVVSGQTIFSIYAGGGLGVTERLTTYSTNISITRGHKLIFDGNDDEDYIWLNNLTSDLEFYVENTKVLDLQGDGQIELKNDFILDATTDGQFKFIETTSAPDVDCLHIDSEFVAIPATSKVLFDGSSGHTYIHEYSDDRLDIVVGGDKAISIVEGASYVEMLAGWKLMFDGGVHTYIRESSDDVLDIVVGGDTMLSLDESVDTGVTSLLGTLKIAEQADASADTSGYGQIWVDTATPNELSFTDDAGNDIIGIGKYHYETKFIGFNNASSTGLYMPMNGYIIEGTTTAGRNEYQSFCAPYNGTIEKIGIRTETAQNGAFSVRVLESSDGTEIPGTLIFRKDQSHDIADDIYQELDLTSPTAGSDYSPLTKGRIYMIFISFASAPNDTNVTIVFKWNILS